MVKLLNRGRAYILLMVLGKIVLKMDVYQGKVHVCLGQKKIHINFSHFYISFLDG